MFNRRQIALATSAVMFPSLVRAQVYPQKPIKIVYNFAPGGTGDAVARYVAQQMTTLLGQQVFVENREGGGSTVGTLAAARAAGDGYTLLCSAVTSLLSVPLIAKDSGFDPTRSMVPLGLLAVMPIVFLAHPSAPVYDVPSFFEFARKQPNGVDVASSGNLPELALAKLGRDAKINIVFVGYRGAAPALQAVLAGEVKIFYSAPTPAMAELVKNGKLRVFAVTTAQPSPLFPGVMPISDYVPGFVEELNIAMWAPPGLPPDIAAKLSGAIEKITADPATAAKFQSIGLSVRKGNPDDARRILARDADNLKKALEASPSFKFGQ